jgi:hypothetical protein
MKLDTTELKCIDLHSGRPEMNLRNGVGRPEAEKRTDEVSSSDPGSTHHPDHPGRLLGRPDLPGRPGPNRRNPIVLKQQRQKCLKLQILWTFCGLYCKHVTNINYASSVINKLKALHTDDASHHLQS